MITFTDLLKYARELKKNGIDTYHRYCILKGFISAAKLGNMRCGYCEDYRNSEINKYRGATVL